MPHLSPDCVDPKIAPRPSWRAIVTLLAITAIVGVPAIAVVLSVSDVVVGGVSPNNLAGARGVAVSPDGNHVYVASEDQDRFVTYDRTGANLTNPRSVFFGATSNPRDVDAVEGAMWAYVEDGAWFVQTLGDGSLNLDPNHNEKLLLSDVQEQRLVARPGPPIVDGTDDRYLAYITTSDTVRAIRATVSDDDTVSNIEIWDTETQGGIDPWGLAISPNAEDLYVAVPSANSLFFYDLISADGSINGPATEYTEGGITRGTPIDGLDSVRSVAVSPDGEFVYTGSTLDGIAIFDRNTGTGALSYVGKLAVAGADLQDLASSPDGQYLAAADPAGDRVFLFSRDVGTGLLTLEDSISNSDIGAGLDGVTGVAFSPDSQFVLAASANGSGALVSLAVSLFSDGFESGDTNAWN